LQQVEIVLRCLLMLACLICSILISHFHLRFLKYLYKSVCKSCVCSSCMKSFAYQMKIHVHACFPAIYLCVNSCVYSCANSCVKHDQKGILEASFLKICPFKNLKGPTVAKGQKGVRNPSYYHFQKSVAPSCHTTGPTKFLFSFIPAPSLPSPPLNFHAFIDTWLLLPLYSHRHPQTALLERGLSDLRKSD
jgi:hypothetical protein